MSALATDLFPARLHVLLAQDAPYGVVIRRGPSRRVCTVGWDREDDSFAVGQWLKGRIYERRCDLSPDGRHLIYFAMNGYRDTVVQGSWTAISHAPYLKAIGLWAKGDCWHGGGLFVDSKTYWINDGLGHDPLEVPEPSELRRADEYPNYVHYGGECRGVYYLRLLRDGWEFKEEIGIKLQHEIATFEKRINDHWILRKRFHATSSSKSPVGKGCYYEEHEIENIKSGAKVNGANWEWADVDRHRVVWTEDGKLFASGVEAQSMKEVVELYNFNAMAYQRIKAPYLNSYNDGAQHLRWGWIRE